MKKIFTILVLTLLATHSAFADDDVAAPPVDKSAYNLFTPVPDDQLRAFSPDRPTKSSGATTVDAGHFQYEADFAVWSYDRYNAANTTTHNFILADPTLKLGLSENTDLELLLAPLNVTTTHDRAANINNAIFGFGDVTTRLKMNLIGNEGGSYAIAVVPFVKAPTSTGGIGNHHWEGGVYAPLNISLPHDFGLNFQSEYDILERADQTHTYSNYQNLVNISHPVIWDNVTGYIEFWSDVGKDAGSPIQYTGDLSLAWSVRDNLQLDCGVNIGLNRAAPDLQTYIGIAQRF